MCQEGSAGEGKCDTSRATVKELRARRVSAKVSARAGVLITGADGMSVDSVCVGNVVRCIQDIYVRLPRGFSTNLTDPRGRWTMLRLLYNNNTTNLKYVLLETSGRRIPLYAGSGKAGSMLAYRCKAPMGRCTEPERSTSVANGPF